MPNSSALYPLEGGRLPFVPTTGMQLVHEASKPTSIQARTGLGPSTYRQWVQTLGAAKPWLADWLYTTRTRPPAEANGSTPTPAMEAARSGTSYSSLIAAALLRAPKLRLSDSLSWAWRQQYKDQGWFDRWLLRGEDAPPTVTVTTVDQADRCERAWDFNELCRRLRLDASTTYVQWIRRGLITSADWLRRLYGWPEPAGSFVVSAGLQRLRTEMSREAIAAAAGRHENAIWQ